MRVLNFGSLNIDNVFSVQEFVRPGETLAAKSFSRGAGGKGLNQSIALARAGVSVFHAGKIGPDGIFLKETLSSDGVDVSFVDVADDEFTGSAMIQVSSSGENCIVLYGGANQNISREQIDRVFEGFSSEDILLIQNEINSLDLIMNKASEKGMRIFFNPAPMAGNVFDLPLNSVDTFIVNEIEGAMLARSEDDVLDILHQKYPDSHILLTLGSRGAFYLAKGECSPIFSPACHVEKVIDTTAAGDTFTGYFISGIIRGLSPSDALSLAAQAAALCISSPGASSSIPAFFSVEKKAWQKKARSGCDVAATGQGA